MLVLTNAIHWRHSLFDGAGNEYFIGDFEYGGRATGHIENPEQLHD
jgi:hypothetical protein